jgi:4-hydroxybenzoate polyprenyltransferase
MARSHSPTQAVIDQAAPRPAASRSTIALLLVSLRPEQWTKNLFVFAGLIFGHRLDDAGAVALATAAFGIFCALSGAVYLFNDVADREGDGKHPLKRMRPIASGALSPSVAITAGVVLGAGGIAAAAALRPALGVAAAAYIGLLWLYSAALKHVVIIDVLTIAAGFVLRAVAGALAIDVPISQWLLVCTTLLALFLVLSKRRHELTILADDAVGHRRILEEYSPYLLDQMVSVVTASSLLAYASYATSPETAERLGTTRLPITIPFVLYGIFRYLYLVHRRHSGGSPSTLLLTDRPLLVCVALWAGSVVALLYTPLGR